MAVGKYPNRGKLKPEGIERATALYFEIEKHFLTSGEPLGFRQVGRMLNVTGRNNGLIIHYLKILRRWGLVTWQPGMALSITLVKRENYPPVEWRQENK